MWSGTLLLAMLRSPKSKENETCNRLKSLGDRLRQSRGTPPSRCREGVEKDEKSRVAFAQVPLSPETSLPCSSEILSWTPHFTSPTSDGEVRMDEERPSGGLEDLRQKVRAIRGALQRSNTQQAEMQTMLSQALDRCESLKVEAADAQRSKEHHHHRWCILDQERESLQRLAHQAKSSEQAAREEAVAWRAWLRSFLELLLRDERDEAAMKAAEITLKHLKTAERSLQPELLAKMPALYESLAEALSGVRAQDAGFQKAQAQAEVDDRVAQLERQLAQKEISLATLEQDKRSLRSEVRTLQNTVQELRGSIRVFCRIRPPKQKADASGAFGVKAEGSRSVCLRKPPGERRHDFNFDRVFSQQAGQRELYEEVGPLLPGILEGIHLCIFAYGQTGAGKTYTLAGQRSSGDPGIQDLAIADLLRLAESFEVRLTALEIYNESIQDLLSDATSEAESRDERLEVRQSAGAISDVADLHPAQDGTGANSADANQTGSSKYSPFGSMRVPGLKSWSIQNLADVEDALQRVRNKRHVASTALNERSSRSHTVISLSVLRRSGAEVNGVPVGVLHIVDLAGSERTKISQAEGIQMKEANCINRSLSALADVLFALGDSTSSAHVPYRNSKLTYLLQDALGGPGCKTFLFAQVSPDALDANESYSTLTFASRVATSVQQGRLRPRGAVPSPSPRKSPQREEMTWKGPGNGLAGTTPPLPRRKEEK